LATKLHKGSTRTSANTSAKDTVLISFGTVVPGNLWAQNASVREPLTQLLRWLLDALDRHVETLYTPVRRIVIVATPDLQSGVVKTFEGSALSSPRIQRQRMRIEWHASIDQLALLASGRVLLFVTHAGCNSIREAALTHTTTLAIPWFGDQHDLAKRVHELRWGVACLYDEKDAAFAERLSPTRQQWTRAALGTSEAVGQQLFNALAEAQGFVYRRDNLPTFSHALRAAVHSTPAQEEAFFDSLVAGIHCHVPWSEGDLLFGTNGDRALFASEHAYA
jgi:hypothetical protein